MKSYKEIELEVNTKGYSPMSIEDKLNAGLIIMASLDELVSRFDEDNVEIIITIEAKGNC
jgi:adenine/guanine phosphoribosyltransferase-like PRPP-binding protein